MLLHRDVPAECQRSHPSVTFWGCHTGAELSVLVFPWLLAWVSMLQILLGFFGGFFWCLHLLLSALPASLCVCHRFSVCFAAVMDPNASSGLLGALRAALSPFCVCCILRAGSGSHPQLQALFTALSLPALPADAF